MTRTLSGCWGLGLRGLKAVCWGFERFWVDGKGESLVKFVA